MKIQFLGVIFLVLLLAQLSHAQTITMDEFLESVKESHPFFAKEALSPEIEMRAKERFLGAQDWSISSSPFFIHQKPISSSSFAADRIDIVGAEIAAERAFWNTGGRFSLSWSTEFADQKIPDIVFPDPLGSISLGPSQLYQHRAFLTYSQPLLKNYKGKLDRLNYELSQYTVDFTEIQALENQEGFLVDLGDRFLDWTLLWEQIRIAKERTSLAEEELQRTIKKRQANLVDQVDVLRAEDAVRIAEQNVVLIESQWKSLQAELAVLAQSPELYDSSPEFDLYYRQALPGPDEAVLMLREKSRILRTLTIRRKQLAHVRDGYVETSRPELFLNVGAGLQGEDEKFGGSLDLDKPDMSVSLLFRYPLENRTAYADIAKTDLELQQLDKEIKNATLGLEAGVMNLLILIREMEKVLELNQEQIESARAKTEEELRLYNQGRGDLTFVIQSRDNEENAKLTYAQNAAAYHKLILQYRALVDEFLPSPGEM